MAVVRRHTLPHTRYEDDRERILKEGGGGREGERDKQIDGERERGGGRCERVRERGECKRERERESERERGGARD